jgi:hypothetical protein
MHATPPPRRKTYRARDAVLAVIAVAAIVTAAGGIDRTLSGSPAAAPAEIATFGPSPDPGFAAAAAPQLGTPPPVPAPMATTSRTKVPARPAAARNPAVIVYRAGPRPAARKAPPPPARKHCRYGKRKEH